MKLDLALTIAICTVYPALVIAVGATGGDAMDTNLVTAGGVVSLALVLLLPRRHT
jgi:hypothetical protein